MPLPKLFLSTVLFSGLITSAAMFSSGKGGAIVAGAIMIIVGLLFGAAALCDGVALIRVSGVKVVSCGQSTHTGILH